MKKIFYGALAAGMLLISGCGSKEEQQQDATQQKESQFADGYDIESDGVDIAAEEEMLAQLSEELAQQLSAMGLDEEALAELDGEGDDDENLWEGMTEEEAEELLQMLEAQSGDAASVGFEMDSDELTDEEVEAIADLAEAAQEAIEEGQEITVAGHCAPFGEELHNVELSERRAEVVKQALVDAGVPGDKIHTAAYGAALPIAFATSDSETAQRAEMTQNCRAEVMFA